MSFHVHPSPSPVTAGQQSSYTTTTTTSVGNHLELAASLWGHFHTDLSTLNSAPPAHSYQRSTISHIPDHDSFPTLDFPSNVPSVWGYQTLLGFTPGSLNQYNPYSIPAQLDQLLSSSPPSQSTDPYAEAAQSSYQYSPPVANVPSILPAHFTTPSQSVRYHAPSSSHISQHPHYTVSDHSNLGSPVFKMFKCTLDPNCEMEFTRAEHLARHERKHTKEKPFKCHCNKSFSRLDNWRQHKVSVHKEEPEQNALTEQRLVQVHKSMQRQNNIRKAATLAAQKQDRLERGHSMTPSSESNYSPAPSSLSSTAAAGYCSQPQPSPFPNTTPDKAHWSQHGTPFNSHSGGLMSNTLTESTSNTSPEILELIFPISSEARSDSRTSLTAATAASHPEQTAVSQRVPIQYSSRLMNYHQTTRAPLSSLWPTFQQSSSPLTPNYLPMQRAGTSPNHGRGLVLKRNDEILSHHSQVLSSLTHDFGPRKLAGSSGNLDEQSYVENQRAYSGFLMLATNTMDSASSPTRKRALPHDEPVELGCNAQINEQNPVKKMRI
ncbi:hypothetical protein PCASD_03636 [Puccinia coronata f. sp. avenae]|uniref:C2H2-type domain-containing protein n=1 Tax=Puccinia coronata f. sp. avenae TaxID=200324 RepID=A0A2N5VDH7_9BASI|nr:hypothetical protein PCASD_03636 [Puccinia coronata f. sp. avenae]